MVAKQQIIRRLSIFLLLLTNNACSIYSMTTTPLSASSKEDLDEAEANGKLEIVKQVKKVNDDGSYTIGYEADDGTFKIESRDVLGNIKGTYGYIDENGDIKRVSYSTNNDSNSETILPKTETDQTINLSEASSSVVQRIPKINKTQSTSTTRRPSNILYHSTATNTPVTPASSTTSSVVIQSIPKRRMTTTTTSSPSTTTVDPGKISDFIKAAVEASKSPSNRGHIYEAASPRILLQQRSSIRAEDLNQRSEGQILRPDVVARPTESPIFRSRKSEGDIEESKSNLLRRQLQPEGVNFDLKRRPLSLHQSQGEADMADVYGSTITASTTRPLFTTLRPKFVSSSTIAPTIQRPTIRYPSSKSNQEYEEEVSTENIPSTTVNSVPVVVQSPPNAEQHHVQGPLIAIKHHLSGRTVLVPLSQLQQVNRYEHVQYNEEVPAEQPVYMAQPQRFRPIQVRIDENGYVRQMPQYHQTPYPIPIRVTPAPQDYLGEEDEINLIKPPVSTRDFQKLLDQLILRQTRLEQISALTKRYQHTFGQRNRPIYNPNLLVYRRQPTDDMNMPLNLEQQNLYNYQSFTPTSESYTPTRRVARLLNARHLQKDDRENDEDYLPPDVREMLLLRMLQLAINPSLPLNIPDNFEEGLNTMTRYRKMGGARNVEILGEEDDTQKLARSKR